MVTGTAVLLPRDTFVHLRNASPGTGYTLTLPAQPLPNTPYQLEEDLGDTATVTLTPTSGTCNGAASCTENAAYGKPFLNFDGTNWTMH